MKKKIRALLCLVLAAAAALSLAACETGGGKAEKPEETPADTLVYTPSFTPVRLIGNVYLNPRCFTDDGFYATAYEKVGERELNDGEALEYDGQLDVYASSIYFVSSSGMAAQLEKYQPMPAVEDTEGRTNFNSGSELCGICQSADGKLVVLEQVYANWFDGKPSELESDGSWEKWHYTRNYYIRRLDTDGSELSISLVDYRAGEDVYFYIRALCLDEDGNLLVVDETKVVALTPDGSVAYTIGGDDYLSNLVRLRDGSLGVTCWGSGGMELRLIDTKGKRFGTKFSLPNNAYDLLPGGGKYDLCYRSGSNLYGIDLANDANEKILNWINCDVNGDYVTNLSFAADGSVTAVLSSTKNGKNETELVRLSPVPASSLPQKQTLTLAVMSLPYDMSDRIIAFNRKSDSVRIELRDYSEYNTEDDWSVGQTKLTTELLSGKVPDLFSLNGLPYSQLAGKGLLEDLYPYLDADTSISREDFFPTVLKAMEYNGALCRICPSFTVQSLIGASSVVGDKPGWDYEQFREALASMPEGCTPLDQYTTREDVLRALMSLDMNDFVDWSTGKCSFESQEFTDLLAFSNAFLEEFNWEDYEWNEDESTPNRIAQGRQMLMQTSISSIEDVMINDLYFGGDSTYIGWPTNNGIGNMISLDDNAYAISASCGNKEAAWSFLRSILSTEYQESQYGLPVVKKVFDAKLKEAMTPKYQTDANGNYILDENGDKIQEPRGGIGFGDGKTYEIYALSQKEADKLLELINTTTKVTDQNDSILNIVKEQAQAYFAGQKSAEEVARLVQSKANIYVNEQR